MLRVNLIQSKAKLGAPLREAVSGATSSCAPTGEKARTLTPAEARTIFLGLMLTVFLAALNQTIVATALPTIGRYFNDFENLSWIVTSYLLTSTAVAPLYGKLSDIHGRRTVMLASIGIFALGSVASAAAPNMLALIFGRALQGVGGGGILPVAQAIMADAIAPRERGRYQAYMAVVWVTSGVGGPILGGVLAEHFHWSLIFWINLPLALAAAVTTYTRLRKLPRHDRRHRLDILGAGLMMASAVLMLLALTWGGTRFAWMSAPIIALVAGAVMLSVGLGWWLVRAPEPFLPLSVLAEPVMYTGTAANSFAMGASIGLVIFVPLYYELVHHLSAADSGLALVPLALTTPGSILSGRAMLHMRRYKWVPEVGLAVGIAGLGLLIFKPALALWGVIAIMSVVGIAIGTVYPVCTVSIQNAVPNHQVGVAMGAMNFFRALASAFAVAAMGAILLAGMGATVERGGSAAAVAAKVGNLEFDFASVFRWVFAAAEGFLVASLATLILMEERPLRGPEQGAPSVPSPAGGGK
ncbi:MAG TPA: MDR family MFS transporter [Xanthobacteraceae bacterium]|jgi:EmrB/QacA subfamily drug resistance transporter|nr:MDR family MFS transporter [Xanthobacteraceae bacterium]